MISAERPFVLDLDTNVRSFHQIKALCLLALIANHCLSFATVAHEIAIQRLGYAPLLLIMPLFNGHFIAMTGVTYRINLESEIRANRVTGGFWPLADLLIFLIFVDFSKNLWLYGHATHVLQWDFLKTILVMFAACYLISRVHIALNFVFVALASWFYADIHRWLYGFRSETLSVPKGLNFYHLHYALFFGALALYLGFRIVPHLRRSRARLLFVGALVLGLMIAVKLLLQTAPDETDYYLARNWWIDALIGSGDRHTLMPVLTWGLGLPLGFALTHFAIRNPRLIQNLNPFWGLAISALFFIPLWLFTVESTPGIDDGFATWISVGQNKTSFAVEVMRTSSLIFLFFLLFILNRRFRRPAFDRFCMKLSISSFWIYLLATSVPFLLAAQSSDQTSLWITIAMGLAVTLPMAYLLSELVYFVSRKRLRFILRKTAS